MWVRPFAPAHAWKSPVRAALLVLAAGSSSVIAWAGALDLHIISGQGATQTLTAGSYALTALFGITISVLVAGIATAMLRGIRDEQARIRATESPTRRRQVGPFQHASTRLTGAVADQLSPIAAVSQFGSAAVDAALTKESDAGLPAFPPLAVRRRESRLRKRTSTQDAGMISAAATL